VYLYGETRKETILKDKTIAVLPFVNMSSNVDNEYFSDGITEEIINVLAKIDGIKVTSRTSSFYFKRKNYPISEIGKQLNVSTILEGSVRLSGKTIRITAQLIQVEQDFHFWSETWDRKLENIFEIQDEVAMAVAEKTREHIGHFEIAEASHRKINNISAYELYLKSKSNFYKFQKNDILLAIDQIQEAIQIDALCPFYHASEAIYFGYMGLIKAMSTNESFEIAKTAAEKAILLDETDPEANYSIGMVGYFFENDLDKAEAFLDLALKYRPNYVNALLGGSVIDVLTNHPERAISRVKKAIEIDPLSPANIYYLAAALLRLSKYEEALVEINMLLKLIPNHTNSYCLKGTILTRLKKYEEALEHYKTVPISSDKSEIYYAGMAIVYATKGDFSKAKEYLEKTKLESQNLHLASEENAAVIINIYLGNFDLAFEEIANDINQHKYYLNFYKEIPAFKLLESDPRYKIFDRVFKTKGIAYQPEQSDKPKLFDELSEEKISRKKALIEESDIENYRNHLLQYMTKEAPYLNPELSLRSLASLIGMQANHLSWLLNESLGKNFNEFINHYRIETFKNLAKNPNNANITVIGLAYDSGFNSKTVFNTYFKKETGLTPKEFLKGL
jgi:adenylate cyclase